MRVLLINELGEGLGHVARLAPIAETLEASGHDAVLAITNPLEVFAKLAGAHRLIPCPNLPRPQLRLPEEFSMASYADLLTMLGFADHEVLLPRLTLWRSWLRELKPDAIILDHSPTAAIAAYGQWPTLMVGDGFTIPPTHNETFPKPNKSKRELVPQALLLKSIEASLDAAGQPQPKSLTLPFQGDRRLICCLQELDPYQALRLGGDNLAPLLPLPASVRPPAKPRIFAYLRAQFRALGDLVAELAASGVETELFIRGSCEQVAKRIQAAPNLTLHQSPPKLSDALARCSLFIHHGGQSSTHEALAVGRPQLILSNHVETAATGDLLAQAGCGLRIHHSRFERQGFREALAKCAGDPMKERSEAFAAKLQAQQFQDRRQEVLTWLSEL